MPLDFGAGEKLLETTVVKVEDDRERGQQDKWKQSYCFLLCPYVPSSALADEAYFLGRKLKTVQVFPRMSISFPQSL